VSLWAGLAAVGGILAAAWTAGFAGVPLLFPAARPRVSERLAWGLALGLVLLAGIVPLGFSGGLRPGWTLFLAGSAALVLGGLAAWRRGSGVGDSREAAPSDPRARRASRLLAVLVLGGVLLYALRALTEPMWANDFLAIWGWKGKTIFGAGEFPAWTYRNAAFAPTHPEYPPGLPYLFAGVSFLLGRWDDHAMGLLFPILQVGSLLLLSGWLARRGAPRTVAMGAAAALAVFEPLYRAFGTGMAEVPLSFFLLLLGASLCDSLEGERGAARRLAVAAFGAAALKNEGLFAAAAAAGLALVAAGVPRRARLRAASAALLPAAAVPILDRIRTGPLPLRDFDFRLLFSREFPIRLAFDAQAIALTVGAAGALGLLALALVLAAGRRTPPSDRLLGLALALLIAYAVLPAFCVLGPAWLVQTAFVRTASALAPLVFAAAALRVGPLFSASSGAASGSGAGPAA
jgi:hypothetical protein